MDEQLLYGYDPLCGWCFAFRPTMAAIRQAYPDLSVELIMGGLVVGERVAPIAQARDYLIKGLEQVRRTAGVSAGAAFYNGLLKQGSYISNSEPPCRAVYVAQQLAPERAYDFADALPEAYYGRGLPLDDADVMAGLAREYGIDADAFLAAWQSEQAKHGTQHAFQQARLAGFNSYPTLVYQHSKQRALVAQGFARPADAVARIAALRTG
ncbi:MAG: DsbA family protein [Roseiflexaceae bacterium]|nr:DsbA family protein [Roseiflexaceae bacterium]